MGSPAKALPRHGGHLRPMRPGSAYISRPPISFI